jgi:hypothetical protein
MRYDRAVRMYALLFNSRVILRQRFCTRFSTDKASNYNTTRRTRKWH